MAFRDRVFEAMEEREDRLRSSITSVDRERYSGWGTTYNFHWPLEFYTTPGFQTLYLQNLFRERYETASRVFARIGLEETPGQAIVSVGCGFGAGLAAAFDFLQQNGNEAPNMKFVGVDPVRGWRSNFDELNKICHAMFGKSSFQFRRGELGNKNDNLFDLLKRKRAAVVILSHVVLDFVENIEAVVSKMFEIKTVKCVVIMERTWFKYRRTDLGLMSTNECQVKIEEYSVQGRETHVVIIERLPVSTSESDGDNDDHDIDDLVEQFKTAST
jgi:hypothetical protein